MKASDLKGRAVVTLSDAAKVGQIDDILFDADLRRVLGIRIKRGTFGKTEAVTRTNVSAVGVDAVTLPSPDVINDEGRHVELQGASSLAQAQRTKVVTEGGRLLGTIGELTLDDEAQTVVAYTLAVPLLDRLRHREPTFEASLVVRLGEGGIMIVSEAVGAIVDEQAEGKSTAEA